MLERITRQHEHDYHKKCQQIKVTHTTFADDLSVIAGATERSPTHWQNFKGVCKPIRTKAKFPKDSGICSRSRCKLEKKALWLDPNSNRGTINIIPRTASHHIKPIIQRIANLFKDAEDTRLGIKEADLYRKSSTSEIGVIYNSITVAQLF